MLPPAQRLLNSYFKERGSAPEGAGQGAWARSREGAEARAGERREEQGLPPVGGGLETGGDS